MAESGDESQGGDAFAAEESEHLDEFDEDSVRQDSLDSPTKRGHDKDDNFLDSSGGSDFDEAMSALRHRMVEGRCKGGKSRYREGRERGLVKPQSAAAATSSAANAGSSPHVQKYEVEFQELISTSRCRNCGERGHWKGEYPKNRAKAVHGYTFNQKGLTKNVADRSWSPPRMVGRTSHKLASENFAYVIETVGAKLRDSLLRPLGLGPRPFAPPPSYPTASYSLQRFGT